MAEPDRSQRHVLYTLLRTVARLAGRVGVPVRDVQDWMRLAYFQELRSAGLTVAEACARLGISPPTGARLSRMLKSDFLGTAEEEHDLPKRIALMLWAGPLSRARIGQGLSGVEPAAIDRALGVLREEGRVVERRGRTTTFEIVRAEDRLVRPGWAARLGALGSLLDNVVDVIHARFFDEGGHAFARTISFRARPEDRAELSRFYEEQLWPFLRDLEERARDAPDREVTRLSILWDTSPEISPTDEKRKG